MPAPKEIIELVEKFESGLDKYKSPDYQEEEVKREFIEPMFSALGWDMGLNAIRIYSEVSYEYRIKTRKAKGRKLKPDYGFLLSNQLAFILEAKQPAVNLAKDPAPARQVRRYIWNADLPASVVTDFEELSIYTCLTEPSDHDDANTGLVKRIHYKEYIDRWDEIYSILSRSAVQRGSLQAFAKDFRGKRETKTVDKVFLGDISAWRESLAKELAAQNIPRLTIYQLNPAVQGTIDRIVFLRICEDRGFEEYGQLEEIAKENNVYSKLCDVFEYADKKYNSSLFHFHEEKGREFPEDFVLKLKISDSILSKIINDLYTRPYDFSVMPPEILGQVYEQFLGKVIILENGEAKVQEKPEVKKAGGVFYTPTYIVNYIVDNTVGRLLAGKTPIQVSDFRILDPACGSGSFLLGAYKKLLAWHLAWYGLHLAPMLDKGQSPRSQEVRKLLPSRVEEPNRKGSKKVLERSALSQLPIFKEGDEWKLTLSERKRILLNNIYGVDIDHQATEVTKLSLLLQVLGDDPTLLRYTEDRILPDLSNNIKCGNSIVSTDIKLSDEIYGLIKPFNWESEFSEIKGFGGFDAVIGNPPYVRQESLGKIKTYFVNHYQVYQGTADLYTYFIERGLELLKEGGIFSYIVGNKWMKANYGKPLRRWLTGQRIDEIIDFGDQTVFQTATTYPCIIRISNGPSKASFPAAQVKTLNFADLETYLADKRYCVNQSALGDNGWSLADERTQALLDKLKAKGVHLGDYVRKKIYRGILTGLNEAFVIDAETKEMLIAEDPKSSEIIRPFLAGRDIKRYQPLVNDKYVIVMPNGWTRAISGRSWDMQGWLKNNYPAIARHLEPFEDKAKARYDQGEYWWELRSCDYYAEFEKPKILWPGISAEVSAFAFDMAGYYGNDNNHLIVTDDLYLLGILNSQLTRFILTNLCDRVQGGFYRLKIIYIEQLPVRSIDLSDPMDKAKHDLMVSLVEQMLDLQKNLAVAKTSLEHELLERRIKDTDGRINRLVYELYGLTEEEIKIIGDTESN